MLTAAADGLISSVLTRRPSWQLLPFAAPFVSFVTLSAVWSQDLPVSQKPTLLLAQDHNPPGWPGLTEFCWRYGSSH